MLLFGSPEVFEGVGHQWWKGRCLVKDSPESKRKLGAEVTASVCADRRGGLCQVL